MKSKTAFFLFVLTCGLFLWQTKADAAEWKFGGGYQLGGVHTVLLVKDGNSIWLRENVQQGSYLVYEVGPNLSYIRFRDGDKDHKIEIAVPGEAPRPSVPTGAGSLLQRRIEDLISIGMDPDNATLHSEAHKVLDERSGLHELFMERFFNNNPIRAEVMADIARQQAELGNLVYGRKVTMGWQMIYTLLLGPLKRSGGMKKQAIWRFTSWKNLALTNTSIRKLITTLAEIHRPLFISSNKTRFSSGRVFFGLRLLW